MAAVLILALVVLLGNARSEGTGNLFKVALTQHGYIQFLRYAVEVPYLRDFTVCIWFKSTNLTHSQPILSYSKHETDRLIRLWISPRGSAISLEVLGVNVMTTSLGITEDSWYHFCQAWSGRTGLWNFYVNTRLMATGEHPYSRSTVIPGGGDLVVGQEYTDFDKGLDDGIEGFVFGFNMLVNSQFSRKPLKSHKPRLLGWVHHHHHRRRRRRRTQGYRQSRSSRKFVHDNYDHCLEGRGSPSLDPHTLVSWARTPVMVFGGAVIKNAHSVCGDF